MKGSHALLAQAALSTLRVVDYIVSINYKVLEVKCWLCIILEMAKYFEGGRWTLGGCGLIFGRKITLVSINYPRNGAPVFEYTMFMVIHPRIIHRLSKHNISRALIRCFSTSIYL
jgi:hypothetical protein